jgi:4'-phosphopantetheinyl transferase
MISRDGMLQIYWLTQTAEDLPAEMTWLAQGEREYLSNLRFARRRDDWLLGRWTAKRALAYYLEKTNKRSTVSYPEIEIRRKPSGAPEVLLEGEAFPVLLSLSHRNRRSLSVLASADTMLGADLELIEVHSKAFLEDYFTEAEKRILSNASEVDLPLLGSLIWSAKEAALKALMVGLSEDTRSVEVDLLEFQPTPGWNPLSVRKVDDEQIFQGWWRKDQEFLLTIVSSPPPALPIYLIG